MRRHCLASSQKGQVAPATYSPASSPIRWLLAEARRERSLRMNSAWRQIELSQSVRSTLPTGWANSGDCSPPISCHTVAQFTRRMPASSGLDQLGPRGYGHCTNQLSRAVPMASR